MTSVMTSVNVDNDVSVPCSYFVINTVVFNQTKNYTMYCDVKRRTKIIIQPVGTKQYLIRLGVTKQYVRL